MHEKEIFTLSTSSYREAMLEAATIHKYRILKLYTIYGVQKFDKTNKRGNYHQRASKHKVEKDFRFKSCMLKLNLIHCALDSHLINGLMGSF